MIITTTGEKGGTGKTTMAVNLAGMKMARGGDLTILDADRQGSATIWCELRRDAPLAPVPVAQSFGRSIYHAALDLDQRYQDVLIDLPSGDTPEMRYVLSVADLAIVTLQPSHLDAWTIGEMDARLERAAQENPRLKAICIINRASSHPRNQDTVQLMKALKSCEFLKTHPTPCRDRLSIKRSLAQGLTAEELKPADKKATAEFQSIYEAIFAQNES